MTYDVTVDGKSHRVELTRGPRGYICRLDGREVALESVTAESEVLWLLLDGRSYEVRRQPASNGAMQLGIRGRRYAAEVCDLRAFNSRRAGAGERTGPLRLVAPMPGKVVRVLKAEGEAVEPGEGVVVVEAMKMQNEIRSARKGVVRKVLVAAGAAVNSGELLAEVE